MLKGGDSALGLPLGQQAQPDNESQLRQHVLVSADWTLCRQLLLLLLLLQQKLEPLRKKP